MTTRQRIDLLARAYPRLFPRAELRRLVRAQLGDVDALDKWIVRDGTRVRARGPRMIYHICAGNLAVSAWTSLAHGLLLGARNVVKLPGDRDDSTARREILGFIRGLPAPLRRLVETQTRSAVQLPQQGRSQVQLGNEVLNSADVVIAFGSDETMAAIRAQTRPEQKFIAHGHALSLLWLAEPNRLTTSQAHACAVDVLTYDQLGCLSPQAIYFPPGTDVDVLGQKLARALEAHWQKLAPKPGRPLAVAARIAEARDMAHALGHRVWLPPGKHLGWTLIHDPEPAFQPSPLHGVIYLRQAGESQLRTALGSVAGRISTVGIAEKLAGGRMSSRLENVFLSLGVSRFCAAGRMQFPPLTWHHDGRPPLADLVTWVDAERLG
jgi:hypothetical protein